MSTITTLARRLLQILQEGVGHVFVHQVRALNQADTAINLERPHCAPGHGTFRESRRCGSSPRAHRALYRSEWNSRSVPSSERAKAPRPRVSRRRADRRRRDTRAPGLLAARRQAGGRPRVLRKRANVLPYLLSDLLKQVVGRRARRCARGRWRRATEDFVRPAHELLSLALDPVAILASAALLASTGSSRGRGRCGLGRKLPRVTARLARGRCVSPNPHRDALVGDRRVEVPVADHVVASFERRADRQLDVLGARRREQRRLRPG